MFDQDFISCHVFWGTTVPSWRFTRIPDALAFAHLVPVVAICRDWGHEPKSIHWPGWWYRADDDNPASAAFFSTNFIIYKIADNFWDIDFLCAGKKSNQEIKFSFVYFVSTGFPQSQFPPLLLSDTRELYYTTPSCADGHRTVTWLLNLIKFLTERSKR